MAAILTGDADIAQDYAISREVEDSLPPIVELLQGSTQASGQFHIDRDPRPRRRFRMPTATGLNS